MAGRGDRTIGAAFGVLGAVLLVLEGLLDLLRGVYYLALGRGLRAFGPFDQSIVLIVVGAVVAIFAILGGARREERSLVSGAVLVVVALAGWLVLGFGSGVLSLLGSILVLIAGVVFLVSAR
ncbi:MAG: hypothetical protein ACLQD8_01555 [Thermoplasmata archaeon]